MKGRVEQSGDRIEIIGGPPAHRVTHADLHILFPRLEQAVPPGWSKRFTRVEQAGSLGWSEPVTLSGVDHPLDRTQELPTEAIGRGGPEREAVGLRFQRGTAAVPEKREPTLALKPELPTGQIVTSGQLKRPKPPLRERLRTLRSGGRWSVFGVIVLVVCWTLWAAQSGWANIGTSSLVLVLILMIAVGLFAVSRLAGGIILEKLLSRTRRSALLSHLAIGAFLTATGISLMLQIEWVIEAWNQAVGIR